MTEFLKQNHRIDSSLTHVTLFPKGKYSIPRSVEPLFLQAYTADFKAGKKLCVAEMPSAVMPLVVDVDLYRLLGDNENPAEAAAQTVLYTQEEVLHTICTYIETVREKLLSPEFAGIWNVLVLEKPAYVSGNKVKNGYHLHFMNLYMGRSDLLALHADVVQKDGMADVDKGVPNNAWLMYGSSKSPDHDPYMVTKMYTGYPPEEVLPAAMPARDELPALLSMHTSKHEIRMKQPPKPVQAFRYGGGISVVPMNRIGSLAQGGDTGMHDTRPLGEVVAEARELMQYVSADRAASYTTWAQIGWILFNVTRGSQEGLDIFDEFSRRAGDKYNAHSVRQLWSTAQQRHITIRSLAYYARTDSPEYAARVRMQRSEAGTLDLMSKFTNTQLAKLLYDEFKNTFVCSCVSTRSWYQFRKGIWVPNDDGVAIRLTMTQFITELLETEREAKDRALAREAEAAGADDELQLALIKSRRAQLHKEMAKNLALINTSSFKHAVQREAVDIFYCEGFSALLDMNPYLIAFSNGVYDLMSDVFRPGIPEDYLSKCMPIDFDESFTEDSPEVQAVFRLLEQLFPNVNIRQYFLDNYCDIFVGGNIHKNILFWTGSGDNGKSILQIVFEKLLGPYAVKLPTTLLTGKRAQSSSASPELMRTGNGVRFVMCQEPDKTEQIQGGCLKELTGNDRFYARGLYKEGCEITPMFKMALICNDPPKIPNSDAATWRRIRLLLFESKFVDHAHPDYHEQLRTKTFQKDKKFAEKIDALIPAFAWVLLNHRKQRTTDVIVEPEEVTMHTENYKDRNDVYRQYANECVMEKEGAKLHITMLYESFREWYKLSIGPNAIPTKMDALDNFTKLFGPSSDGSSWYGKQLRIENEDAEE